MFRDLSGMKFNHLTVIEFSHLDRDSYWRCLCDCGTEKVLKGSAITHKTHPVKSCGCLKKKSFGESNFNRLYYYYSRNAKSRNLEFSISKEDFRWMTQCNCNYCGSQPSNVMSGKDLHGNYLYNGIDRVDNNLGYVKGNCVPCCHTCNVAKNNMEHNEFINWIYRVHDYLGL